MAISASSSTTSTVARSGGMIGYPAHCLGQTNRLARERKARHQFEAAGIVNQFNFPVQLVCQFQTDQPAAESAMRRRAHLRPARFLPLQRNGPVVFDIPPHRYHAVVVGKRAVLYGVGCKLVEYDAKSKGAFRIERHRRALKQDAVLALDEVGFEAVVSDIAKLHVRPLLARQETVRTAERIDAPHEFVGE